MVLVMFAAIRQGGAEASDYWTLATVLELAIVGRDDQLVDRVLLRLVATEPEGWMLTTTADNLELVRQLREGKEPSETVERVIGELRKRAG